MIARWAEASRVQSSSFRTSVNEFVTRAANDSPAPTERWTLDIEKPFIEKIKTEAEAEHVTVTEVINRIIRHYYVGG